MAGPIEFLLSDRAQAERTCGALFEAANANHVNLMEAQATIRRLETSEAEAKHATDVLNAQLKETTVAIRFLEQELDYYRSRSRHLQDVMNSTSDLSRVLGKKTVLDAMEQRSESLKERVRRLKAQEAALIKANKERFALLQLQNSKQKLVTNTRHTFEGAKLFTSFGSAWDSNRSPTNSGMSADAADHSTTEMAGKTSQHGSTSTCAPTLPRLVQQNHVNSDNYSYSDQDRLEQIEMKQSATTARPPSTPSVTSETYPSGRLSTSHEKKPLHVTAQSEKHAALERARRIAAHREARDRLIMHRNDKAVER